VRLEVSGNLKNSVTLSGIESATIRLVALFKIMSINGINLFVLLKSKDFIVTIGKIGVILV
jgi:hypothetical protein